MEKLKQKAYTLLRKSESVFKTDMVYIAQGSFWLGLSQVVVSASALLIAVAFARFIPKEAYGQYKYILSIIGLLSTLTLTGLGTALTQSVSHGFEGTLEYAFWQNIKWSFLFCLSFLCLAIYYFSKDNISIGISLLIVGSLSPILKSTNFYNSFLYAKKDFRRSSIYFGMIGNIFPYAAILGTMILTSDPMVLVSVYFISNTIIGIILYKQVLRIYKPNDKIDPHLINYSKHLSLINILSVVANNIDQILVFHYIGAAELAIYNFAIAIPNQIKVIPSTISNIVFPKFATRDDKEIRSNMPNKMLWLSLLGLSITTAYIVSAPYIFHLFFPKYTDSIFYSKIAILPLLFVFLEPAASYLSAKKKIKEQYIISSVTSVLQIIIMLIGVIKWGLLGLVIARAASAFIGYTLMGILYEISSKKAVQESLT